MANSGWLPFPADGWDETYATLHLWTQVVGKVALATAPPLNHCWGSALHLTARGLTTGLLAREQRTFTIEFDFIDHQLVVAASDGARRTLGLQPRSVAAFYRAVMDLLADMGLPVKIWPVAVELPERIRLDRDTTHQAYAPAAVTAFWRLLLEIERVLTASRCRFIGKASPSNFFWGSFDLALTRFSGRPAPPRDGPAFMKEAYSHEVISHGFWPGSGAVPEPAFYAYDVPEPAGFKETRVRPGEAAYHAEMGEFILPYAAVLASGSPESVVAEFIDSTYTAAATLAGWDRRALER